MRKATKKQSTKTVTPPTLTDAQLQKVDIFNLAEYLKPIIPIDMTTGRKILAYFLYENPSKFLAKAAKRPINDQVEEYKGLLREALDAAFDRREEGEAAEKVPADNALTEISRIAWSLGFSAWEATDTENVLDPAKFINAMNDDGSKKGPEPPLPSLGIVSARYDSIPQKIEEAADYCSLGAPRPELIINSVPHLISNGRNEMRTAMKAKKKACVKESKASSLPPVQHKLETAPILNPEQSQRPAYETVSLLTLADQLKPIHPANIRKGATILGWFAANEMKQEGWVPPFGAGTSGSPTEEHAWMVLAIDKDDVDAQQQEYGKVLNAVLLYLWPIQEDDDARGYSPEIRDAAIKAVPEIWRIGNGLGFELAFKDEDNASLDPIAAYMKRNVDTDMRYFTDKEKQFFAHCRDIGVKCVYKDRESKVEDATIKAPKPEEPPKAGSHSNHSDKEAAGIAMIRLYQALRNCRSPFQFEEMEKAFTGFYVDLGSLCLDGQLNQEIMAIIVDFRTKTFNSFSSDEERHATTEALLDKADALMEAYYEEGDGEVVQNLASSAQEEICRLAKIEGLYISWFDHDGSSKPANYWRDRLNYPAKKAS